MASISNLKVKKSDFDAGDKFGFSGIGQFVMDTIKNYDHRSKIESFVYLHGAIEVVLFNIWGIFLMCTLKEKFKPLDNFWEFKDSIILLEQVSLLGNDLKSKLLAFKKGRDSVSHIMTNKFHKKTITDKILDDQFKKGISAYKDLIMIRNKLIQILKKL